MNMVENVDMLSKNLSQLRKYYRVTFKELVLFFGKTVRAVEIKRWESGELIPDSMQKKMLAETFDVTVDELCKEEVIYRRSFDYFFAGKLEWLRYEKGFTRLQLATKVGCTGQAILSYEHGISFPSESMLKKIATVFEKEVSYFIPSFGGCEKTG